MENLHDHVGTRYRKEKKKFRYRLIHSDEFLIDITDSNRNSTYNIVLWLESSTE